MKNEIRGRGHEISQAFYGVQKQKPELVEDMALFNGVEDSTPYGSEGLEYSKTQWRHNRRRFVNNFGEYR